MFKTLKFRSLVLVSCFEFSASCLLLFVLRILVAALVFSPFSVSAATISASLKPAFQADLTNSLKLQAGYGNPTFTRATIATVQDWEGLIKNVLSGEARFTGARRVGNLVTGNSENYTGWTNYGSPTSVTLDTSDYPAGTSKSTVISNDAVYEGKTVGSVFVVGKMYRASIWAKGSAGGEFIMFTDGLGTGGSVAVTTSWARYSILFTAANSSGAVLVSQAGAATVKFSGVLWEEVTGQSNTNPAEYVSCGVLAAPYHGAGVDCVKYFNTLNGNTVASNVVTAGTGSRITSSAAGASSATTDTTGPLGYLAEGARTNLVLQSQTLGTTWTQEGGAINEDQIASPDGTVTADKFTLSATTNRHRVYQIASSGVAGTTNVASVYVKAGTAGWFSISDASAGIFYAKFDAVNGVVGATGGANFQSASITPLPNGWYRIAMVYSTAANPNTINFALGDTQAHVTDANSTWTAAGTETGYFWGAQVEAASFASSYIPTTTGSAARNADVLIYPAANNIGTGNNNVYFEAAMPSTGTEQLGLFGLSNSSGETTNSSEFYSNNRTSATLEVYSGGVHQASIGNTIVAGALTRYAGVFATNDARSYANGGLSGSDTLVTLSSGINRIRVGTNRNAGLSLFGTIRNVKIWKKALTDAQLKTMTNTSTATARAAVPQTTAKSPTKTGLVGHWTFDEGTGTRANDSSGLGNTGTLVGSPTWATGKLGKALSFNGSNQFIRASVPAARTSVVTVSAWIKPASSMTSRQDFLASGSAALYSTNNWIFSVKGNTGVTAGLSVLGYSPSSSADLSTTGAVLTTGAWSHVVFVSDGVTTTIYVNGVSVKSGALSLNAGNTTGEFIGASSNDGVTWNFPFNGSIDDARVYNRALSAAEVAALYKSTAVVVNASTNTAGGSLTSGLVGLWSFDGKDVNWGTGTAYDRSGSGNNGSLVNMSTSTSPAIGKIGQALKFDGSTNYISVSNSASLQPLTGDWSVGFWIYRLGTGAGDYPQVIGSRPWVAGLDKGWAVSYTTASGLLCSHFADGTTGFDVNTSGASCSVNTVPLNSWQHWVAVFSRSTGKLVYYKNGALDTQNSPTFPSGTVNQTDNANIGREIGGANNRKLNARLDDVRVYNRALSATEVKALYNLGR
jgi:hypothetical protein